MTEIINAADLFCGGGGTSSGLINAAQSMGRKVNLVAVNHWHIALNTHRANYPDVRHLWADLDSLNPREVLKDMPGKKLNILVASPECIYHSNARGGKPVQEQLRASAWCVPRWIEAGQPDEVLLENVPEFRSWGPLDIGGKRMSDRAGETYQAYLNAIRSLGYTVEDRIINAADYGDPTTRTRLFIRARKGDCKIIWPEASHNETGEGLNKWVAARDIIDWSIKGKSIFNRKIPLKPATLLRIEAGLRKFGGQAAEPFLIMMYSSNDARSVHRPMPTITAGGNHIGLCEPFILPHPHGSDINTVCRNTPPRSIDRPLQTITGSSSNNIGLVEPVQLDILFRMLQPHELARAMSFPEDYKFFGTKAEIVKQIGNAVPSRTAAALCKTMMAA